MKIALTLIGLLVIAVITLIIKLLFTSNRLAITRRDMEYFRGELNESRSVTITLRNQINTVREAYRKVVKEFTELRDSGDVQLTPLANLVMRFAPQFVVPGEAVLDSVLKMVKELLTKANAFDTVKAILDATSRRNVRLSQENEWLRKEAITRDETLNEVRGILEKVRARRDKLRARLDETNDELFRYAVLSDAVCYMHETTHPKDRIEAWQAVLEIMKTLGYFLDEEQIEAFVTANEALSADTPTPCEQGSGVLGAVANSIEGNEGFTAMQEAQAPAKADKKPSKKNYPKSHEGEDADAIKGHGGRA